MFITGQQVVCIDDTFSDAAKKLYVALPVKDVVYVVRGMSPGIALNCVDAEIAVYLIGIHNPRSGVSPFREFGFKAERFAPLLDVPAEEIIDKNTDLVGVDGDKTISGA